MIIIDLYLFLYFYASRAVPTPKIRTSGVYLVVFLAPQSEFLLLGANYAALAELLVAGYLSVRELAVLAEYDVEAHSEDAQGDHCR